MELRNTIFASVLSLTTLLSGCSLFSDDDAVKVSPLPKVNNTLKVKKSWSTSVGDGVGENYSLLRPAYLDDVIFAADRFGIVKALNAQNGKEIWRINLADKAGLFSFSTTALLSGGITAADGNLYIGSEAAKVYSLSAKDGTINWQTTVAGEVLARPVVSDNFVLVHTSNGFLQALDQSDGTIKWTVNLDEPSLSLRGLSTPAVAHGAAIVGGDNGRITAVFIERGQLIWQERISRPTGVTEIDRLSDVDMTPIINDNVVYAIGYNGELTALELRSGQILWQRAFGSVNDFIIDNNQLFFVDQTDRVMAINLASGASLWTQSDLLHRQLTAPLLFQGYIIVGDSEGYLHWLDRETGNFVNQLHVSGSGLLSAPQVMNNNLVVQARNGKVYSFSQ